jgi:hypothetical protein
MRYELICDLAGIPSIDRPPPPPPSPRLPPLPPKKRKRRHHLHKPCPPRAPEPNLLAMGEVDLICWETMPPPTP